MAQRSEDTSGIGDDAPETPAPLFAIRAFKQAIFGTPKSAEARRLTDRQQPRRHRNARLEQSRTIANTKQKEVRGLISEQRTPTSSPRKKTSILSTPGTAGKYRKTVSFDPKNNDLLNTGLTPNAVPGRFPTPRAAKNGPKRSPSAQLDQGCDKQDGESKNNKPSLGINKTDENLGNFGSVVRTNPEPLHDLALDDEAQLEMRRLIKKERVAKQFAKSKEEEVSRLREELAAEKRKVEALEEKVEHYLRLLQVSTPTHDGDNQSKNKTEKGRRGDGSIGALNNHDTNVRAPEHHSSNKTNSNSKSPHLRDISKPDLEPNSSQGKDLRRKPSKSTAKERESAGSDIWTNLGDGFVVNDATVNSQTHRSPADVQSSLVIESKAPRQGNSRRPLSTIEYNKVDSRKSEKDKVAKQVQHELNLDTLLQSSGTKRGSGQVTRNTDRDESSKSNRIDEGRRQAARERLEEKRRVRLGL